MGKYLTYKMGNLDEYKHMTALAIATGFSFMIALTWRDYLQKVIAVIVKSMGMDPETNLIMGGIAAVIVTFISVTAIIVIGSWDGKVKEKMSL